MAFLQSSRFDPAPRRTISWSRGHQQRYQLDDLLIDRLDNTEVLGGEDISGYSVGHTGCVNALSWSPSGQLLASGSDDRNVVLWKLGSDDYHPVADPSRSSRIHSSVPSWIGIGASRRANQDQATRPNPRQESAAHPFSSNDENQGDAGDIVQEWPQRSFPKMGLGMLGKIETGHRANIFSVKWAPNASESRLFTCAGDSHVRVFDINYMASSTCLGSDADETRISPSGHVSSTWSEHSGACIRLFRCHRGRAKRISTEVSPDVFLTCGEDGDVRQMDLRVPHTCRSRTGGSCPPPLAHYPSVLYSLSVSKLEPWLFAVAGESSLAYLHDRRMIPRLIKRDWGMPSQTAEDALTMCVRSFGLPPGGFESPWVQSDGRTALASDEPQSTGRRLLMGNRNSITACKLSEHNGRDLLVSYSSGHVYRFDIYDEPGALQANLDKVRFSLDTEGSPQSPKVEGSAPKPAGRPAAHNDVDVEMGEAKSRCTNRGQEETHGAATLDADHDEQRDGEIEEDMETTEPATVEDVDSQEARDHSGEFEDEEEDAEDEDSDDDFDEGELTDEDLVHHLLEEESRSRSTSATAPCAPTVYPRSAYKGHCNKETVKDVAFAGRSDGYVISGSDDGNWFMWDKLTSEIKGIWHGDSSVVNVMAMHPDLPVFAISGIDDTIKIFAPISVTPFSAPLAAAKERGEGGDAGSVEGRRKRARTKKKETIQAHKLADRLPEKDDICERNERQLQRDFVSPAASILWRLHPRLLGIDVDDDPERQIEGDCIVM